MDLNLNGVYVYNAAAGEGVDVYVLDTYPLFTIFTTYNKLC